MKFNIVFVVISLVASVFLPSCTMNFEDPLYAEYANAIRTSASANDIVGSWATSGKDEIGGGVVGNFQTVQKMKLNSGGTGTITSKFMGRALHSGVTGNNSSPLTWHYQGGGKWTYSYTNGGGSKVAGEMVMAKGHLLTKESFSFSMATPFTKATSIHTAVWERQ